MASIKAGTYTLEEIFRKANFDFADKAAADYNDGNPDYRRVKVGGLGFDSLDEKIVVPVTANELVISLDGESAEVLSVELDEDQRAARSASFEAAADAEDN
jgi:hypothetical protein